MTFGTAYSVMYPDGTWAGELMQMVSGLNLDSDYAMDVLTARIAKLEEIIAKLTASDQ